MAVAEYAPIEEKLLAATDGRGNAPSTPITEEELVEFALGEWSPDVRRKIIADLSRDEPSGSVYGWHEFISPVLVPI